MMIWEYTPAMGQGQLAENQLEKETFAPLAHKNRIIMH